MATITNTAITRTNPNMTAWVVSWPAMGNADQGSAIEMPECSEKSVQITGTFASATVTFKGSNDGTNWTTLTDPQGNAISKTAADLEAVSEHTRYVRPETTGGVGTSVTVTLFMKGQRF